MSIELIEQQASDEIAVSGTLHLADVGNDVLVFAHGAGSDRHSPLLVSIAEEFCAAGISVLRIDLPYRQKRPTGPPSPSKSNVDRAGLAAAAELMRQRFTGPVYLGGQSYGGRQATMLAAENPTIADALFLTSYPLHPPAKPEKLRTAHWPQMRAPAFFAHGTRDNFGTIAEMESALKLIAPATRLHIVERGGHGLVSKREGPERLQDVVGELPESFSEFVTRADFISR